MRFSLIAILCMAVIISCGSSGASSQQNSTDTTPPARSNSQPTGTLSDTTTQTAISLTTDENATCKYATSSNTAYSSMTNSFTNTGGASHSETVSVSSGQSYNYYVRCQDSSGNSNTDDYPISFSVSATATGTIFLQELFEDTSFTSRGWYDSPDFELNSTEYIAGSTNSAEFHFAPGATVPRTSANNPANGRVDFTETEKLYVSFYIKYSANWDGSNKPYHPHEFHILTNADPQYTAPADTHLTLMIEHNEGVPLLAMHDNRNIDTNCILLTNGSFNGCNGNFDSYTFTENRSASSCNGLVGGLDKSECFPFLTQTGYYGKRWWNAPSKYFTDQTESYSDNNWQFIEVMFEMNTISGGVGIADGKIRYWNDGQLIISYDNILFRTNQYPNIKFKTFIIGPYIGDGSPVDQFFWMDNLTIADYRAG